MIDCMKTENYLAIKLKLCEIGCNRCPLSFVNNGKNISCGKFETRYPRKAIELVQQWSNKNSEKTFLTELLKNYPNVKLRYDGVPDRNLCPYQLGLMNEKGCEKYHNCVACWNQPISSKE